MLYRIYLKKENNKCFIGKDFNNKKYKIMKNKETEKFKIENDYSFYANKVKGFMIDTLTPISDEEAGVIQR